MRDLLQLLLLHNKANGSEGGKDIARVTERQLQHERPPF